MDDDFFSTPARHLAAPHIEALLRTRVGETASLDFKQPAETKKLSMDMAAMANSGGGRIVVGVKDPERDFQKNRDPAPADLLIPLPKNTPIEAQVRGWVVRIRPPIRCETRLIDVGSILGNPEAGCVAVIEIEATDWGIHQDESGVFPIRVGSQTVPAPWEVVRDRLAGATRTPDVVERRYPRFQGQRFGPPFNVQKPFARINAALMPRTPFAVQDDLMLARRIVTRAAEYLGGRHRETTGDRIDIDAQQFHMGLSIGFDGDAAFNASPESVIKQRPFFKPETLERAIVGAGALDSLLSAFFSFYAAAFREEMAGHTFVVRVEVGGQGAHLGFDPEQADPRAARAQATRGVAWSSATDVRIVQLVTSHDVRDPLGLASRLVKATARQFGLFLDDALRRQPISDAR